MLKQRLISASILLTVAVASLTIDYQLGVGKEGLALLPLLMFFAIGTAWEIATILRGEDGKGIRRGVAVTGAGIVSLSAAVPMLWTLFGSQYPTDCPVGRLGWIVIASVFAVFIALLAEMKHYGVDEEEKKLETNVPGNAIRRTCSAVFVSLYVGLPMAILVSIRSMFPGGAGLAALVTMIAVTKFTDTGAYFVGRAFGKRKLIPRLSPGKTWEGVIGGIVTATLVAFACLHWLFPEMAGTPVLAESPEMAESSVQPLASARLTQSLLGAIVLGPALAVSGVIGDLAESLFKRDGNVKDSGSLLPGLGGVWDVTDSLIAASLPAFLCYAAGIGA